MFASNSAGPITGMSASTGIVQFGEPRRLVVRLARSVCISRS